MNVFLMIVLITKQWNDGYIVCVGDLKYDIS